MQASILPVVSRLAIPPLTPTSSQALGGNALGTDLPGAVAVGVSFHAYVVADDPPAAPPAAPAGGPSRASAERVKYFARVYVRRAGGRGRFTRTGGGTSVASVATAGGGLGLGLGLGLLGEGDGGGAGGDGDCVDVAEAFIDVDGDHLSHRRYSRPSPSLLSSLVPNLLWGASCSHH